MTTSYKTIINNLKPQGWSRQTVADGQALNNSFLEPTHQKDLTLAKGLDATNARIDNFETQITALNQCVSNASAHYISAITTDNDTISGDGVTNPIGINNTYVTGWNEVTAKQNKADMSAYPTFVGMSTSSDYYCWSGTSGECGQWSPISDMFYSKNNVISGDHTGVSSGDHTGVSSDVHTGNFTYTYIPMDIVTATPTANDSILHIILES